MVKIAKAKAGRTRTSMLKYALEYADLGYYVVPLHSITAGHCTCPKKVSCPSAGKHPLTSNGVHDATRNRKRIKKWFSKYPHANIGIATGLGKGLLVLDVDKKNKGYKTLSRLKTELGNLPITIVSNTGGGGRHYLLKHPKWVIKKDNRGKLFGEGIDVLTDGCFFAAPPSLHISGQKYSWAEGKGPIELGPKALPRSWLKKISAGIVALPTLPLTKLTESKILIREGQRNSFLTTIAGGLLRSGLSSDAILAALLKENAVKCNPPLTEVEVEGIATSISRYSAGSPQGDRAELVVEAVLNQHFAGGEHLLHLTDGFFWHYTGTHWVPCSKKWLEGRVLVTIKASGSRGGTTTSGLVQQTMALLAAQQAVPDDRLRFLSEPQPIINCRNGEVTIDENGKAALRSHKASSYLRHYYDVNYDPDEVSPRYDKALREIFCEAPDVEAMCRHWDDLVGYIMFPRRNIPLILLLQGSGANGKTSLMELIMYFLGTGQISAGRLEDLDSTRFAIGNLLGKLLFVDDDVKAGVRLPDGILKKISEQKRLTGEKKYGAEFEFICMTVPVLLCNNTPSLNDVSLGMTRRLMVIPFEHHFGEDTADKNLFNYIKEHELSGVLNRALKGLRRVIRRGSKWNKPQTVKDATVAWLQQSNPLPGFVEDCCEIDPAFTCYSSDLYRVYQDWARDNGFTLNQQQKPFQRNLAHLGYAKATKGNRGAKIGGLRLIKPRAE